MSFIKDNFNTVRIYVKNVVGTWSKGGNFNEQADIFRTRGAVDLNMGRIDADSAGHTMLVKLL